MEKKKVGENPVYIQRIYMRIFSLSSGKRNPNKRCPPINVNPGKAPTDGLFDAIRWGRRNGRVCEKRGWQIPSFGCAE